MIKGAWFCEEERKGGGEGSPDWKLTYALAKDTQQGELFILEEWEGAPPGRSGPGGSRRITLSAFMSNDTGPRKALFELMHKLID